MTEPLPEQVCKLCGTRSRLIAARAAGLHTVRVGNRHLLSHDY